MNKDFIPYESAIELKQLGFDLPSISGYSYPESEDLLTQAILYQQAFRWFRDKFGYYVDFFVDDDETIGYMVSYFVDEGRVDTPISWSFSTYEEAELACLKKLIEIIKNK